MISRYLFDASRYNGFSGTVGGSERMRGDGGRKICPAGRLLFCCALFVLAACLAFAGNPSARTLSPRDRSIQEFVSSLWPLAEERLIKRETFDRAFAGVSFDPKVIANTVRQP